MRSDPRSGVTTTDSRSHSRDGHTGSLSKGVPRSTAERGEVQSAQCRVALRRHDRGQLRVAFTRLRGRHQRVLAILRLMVVLIKAFGLSLRSRRLPDVAKKSTILRALESSRGILPVRIALRRIGLSSTRYRAWRQLHEDCALEMFVLSQDFAAATHWRRNAHVKSMVLADSTARADRHARHRAQRLKVFASTSTQHRLVRVQMASAACAPHLKPKVGIRATKPNGYGTSTRL